MKLATKISTEQQAEIDAAHIEICRTLSEIDKARRSLSREQFEQYVMEVNRWYPTSTLQNLLLLLREQIGQLHGLIADVVAFSDIPVEMGDGFIEAEARKDAEFVQLANWLHSCLEEVEFVRVCLGYRIGQELSC